MKHQDKPATLNRFGDPSYSDPMSAFLGVVSPKKAAKPRAHYKLVHRARKEPKR